jgi:hypothetical protein
MIDEKETEDPRKEYDFLATAKERFRLCDEQTSHIRIAAKEDAEFELGEQWPEDIKRKREKKNRPCLTINRTASFTNQVINDNRQNRPSMKVRPADSQTDPKTADVINGLIRHVQYDSDAETAFDTAFDHAVTTSMGFFRVTTDYVDETSFDQEIKIDRIDNQFSVYYPVHLCHKADYSDAPYCFITSKMSKSEYRRRFGDDPDNWDLNGEGDTDTQWLTDDSVVIAEYFVVEETYSKLYLVRDENGNLVTVDRVPKGYKAERERDVPTQKIKWYLINGKKILDEKDWPGKYIPVIPVLGKEICLDGKKHYKSLIRDAKDPQRMYNFWFTAYTEQIALAPKAPMIGAKGQFEGLEHKWRTANEENYPYLEYNPQSHQGALVPAPQRQPAPSPSSAYTDMLNIAVDNLKATTGIFDASLGASGNETSGRAIIARQRQGNTANFHFTDNQTRALRYCCRILVDLIPKIYDTARAIRIVGEDMADKVVMVNQLYLDETTGEERLYDLTVGKYDVIVDVGPSYATKRQEAADALLQFVQAYPPAAQAAGDLIAKNMDFPGADALAERLNKMVPPELLSDEERAQRQAGNEDELRQIIGDLERFQAENEQLKAFVGQQQEQLQMMQQEAANKEADRQVEMDKAVIKADTELQKEQIRQQPNMVKAVGDISALVRGSANSNDTLSAALTE